MIRTWRIVHPRNSEAAFTGDGSRRNGGRWNSKGSRAVYLAESLALATFEVMVHGLPYETLQDYICIPVDIPPKFVMSLEPANLPENWRDDPPPAELRKIGDQWLFDQKSPVLKIPSSVIPVESNYLLNPRQKDFGKIRIGISITFS